MLYMCLCVHTCEFVNLHAFGAVYFCRNEDFFSGFSGLAVICREERLSSGFSGNGKVVRDFRFSELSIAPLPPFFFSKQGFKFQKYVRR